VIVGIEACGYTNWLEELIEGLGHKLLVGDAAEIRRLARRRQKNDRRDAELLLDQVFHHGTCRDRLCRVSPSRQKGGGVKRQWAVGLPGRCRVGQASLMPVRCPWIAARLTST